MNGDDEELVRSRCDRLLAEADPRSVPASEFLGRQFDLGLAWVDRQENEGGLGVDRSLQKIVHRRLVDAGAPQAPPMNVIGHGMAAPTIFAHGTPEQRQRFLRPLFTAEELWCQLFSEPGAGSDLAGVRTSAKRDGADWVVNGQKVWTTLAHLARWGLLVARTSPDVPKHKGLTYFVLDMQTPGVDVRPLFQATGEAEFNEVFFNDVRVPDDHRLSDVDGGWPVILTTLTNERVAVGGQTPKRGGGLIGSAIQAWNEHGHTNPVRREQLMELWCRAEAQRLTNIRARHNRTAGQSGPEGSIGKIVFADLNKRISELTMDLLGASAMLKPDGYPMDRPTAAMHWSTPQQTFLRARANSIEGGTTEIAKNILAERVLGLPGEPRVDRDVPWRQVSRS